MSLNFDVSQIKGGTRPTIHQKVQKLPSNPESANYLVEDGNKDKLVLMVQENSFWNHHLFRASYRTALIQTIVIVSIIALTFLLSIGTGIIDKEFLIPRILLLVLTGTLLWREIDKIWIWYESANTMLALDNSIGRQNTISEDFLLHTFAVYTLSKATTPLIKSNCYNKHREMLNKAWETRFHDLYEQSLSQNPVESSQNA